MLPFSRGPGKEKRTRNELPFKDPYHYDWRTQLFEYQAVAQKSRERLRFAAAGERSKQIAARRAMKHEAARAELKKRILIKERQTDKAKLHATAQHAQENHLSVAKDRYAKTLATEVLHQ